MTDVTARNFGLLIAFVIPGFIIISAASAYSTAIRSWIVGLEGTAPTVGGFLYITIASVAAGLIVSAVRWLILDTIHHRTGITQPNWDFASLDTKQVAFDALAENHYRYFQFYGNTLMATLLTTFSIRGVLEFIPFLIVGDIVALVALWIVLFVASRDALRKYYQRTSALLNSSESKTLDE